ERPDGEYRMKIKRKRPGTLGICALIQNKYNVDAVPHVICQGFTKEETEDFLIELHYLDIDNVLAIRGDYSGFRKPIKYGRSVNNHAIELVNQINDMNKGKYLEDSLLDAEPTSFGIGISGYPEKHFEAPNLQTDIGYTKSKIEKGAEYIVTQMFYDNKRFFDYVEQCKNGGIDVPIIPGLKIITAKSQLKTLPSNFHVDIPSELSEEISAAKTEHVTEIGVKWAFKQAEELLNAKVPAIHFYVMQNTIPIKSLMKKLGK
ncbi:MAG: methylenetetrahydrofolate reductase, partial [Melioribacteraceae bacterium]|nr:methylenetetrahydrofolate reductase [Melioribacteraceae bacterium]